MWVLEHGVNRHVATFGDAMYWSFITVTTVGYGDISPVTPAGRILAGLLIFAGIGVVGLALLASRPCGSIKATTLPPWRARLPRSARMSPASTTSCSAPRPIPRPLSRCTTHPPALVRPVTTRPDARRPLRMSPPMHHCQSHEHPVHRTSGAPLRPRHVRGAQHNTTPDACVRGGADVHKESRPGEGLVSHRVAHCSIVGAGGRNDRVRDGNGCGPAAQQARTADAMASQKSKV